MMSSIGHGSHAAVGAEVHNVDVGASCRRNDEERMLALIVFTQSSRRDAAEGSVNMNFEQLEKLRNHVKEAIEAAREAKEDEGFWSDVAGFFGSDVASIAGAIAAVAAVVATGGAAAAVLAVVASGATLAAQHAKELGIPPEMAMGIAIAASVAGLCCGNAQSLVAVGEKVATMAKSVKTIALVAQGAAAALGGATGAIAGQFAADALDHRAEGKRAEGEQQLVSTNIDEALDALKTSLERQFEATKLANSMQASSASANATILNHFAWAA